MMMRDLRLEDFNLLNSPKDEYIVPMEEKENGAKQLFEFRDPFDGLYSFMGGSHGQEERVIMHLKQQLADCEDDAWKYMCEIGHIYQNYDLRDYVYEQCQILLSTAEAEWFSWVESIPYEGIQSLLIHRIPSMEGLQAFLEFLSTNACCLNDLQKRARLMVLLIMEFQEKLNRIKSNIEIWQRRYKTKYILEPDVLKRWEIEDAERAEKFAQTFCSFPKEQWTCAFFSMMNSFWNTAEQKRAPYAGMMRNEIIASVTQKYHDAQGISVILREHSWAVNKSSVLHRLLLYAEWSTSAHIDLSSYQGDLWKAIMDLLMGNLYFHYSQQDDLLFPWLCGKLLSDDNEPQKRLEDMLQRYHVRIGGWKFNYEMFAKQGRNHFFLLTVGAMSAEHLRDQDMVRARTVFDYVFREGNYALDTYYHETPDELQFLVQTWSRRALFLSNPISSQEADEILYALNRIDSLGYKLNAIDNLFLNLDEDQKRNPQNKKLWEAIVRVLDEDLAFENHRNEYFDNDLNEIKRSMSKIKEQMGVV